MTADEYEKLPAVERKRFMECPECREMLSLEESPTSSRLQAFRIQALKVGRERLRVHDDAGNVIETHEHKGDFREW